MGCDIHPHIEVKINGKWEHYSIPNIYRAYGLFAKICGVRNQSSWNIEPISKPKGLPPDLSLITKICAEYEDGHSHTWLSKEEFQVFLDWANNPENYRQDYQGQFEHHQIGYINGNTITLRSDNHAPEITDMRFICWFDN